MAMSILKTIPLIAFLFPALPSSAETWSLTVSDSLADDGAVTQVTDYTPLPPGNRPWEFCISYPHLKDAYWLSVNYGMVEEARRLGVGFRLVEAGGYPNLERQIGQIKDCVAEGADALILGAVSYDGLTPTITGIAERIPVIATVNDVAPEGIAAKALVSWYNMGAAAGKELATRHPAGSAPVRIGWFPGPRGAGWVDFVDRGFRDAIKNSSARIVAVKYGDTGREIQVTLVEEMLEQQSGIDYLVGSAAMAEAAISILRAHGLQDRIRILSDYMSHPVSRGIRRGRILAAPSDFPVMQGRLAIELAVRAVEGKLLYRRAGPAIEIFTADTIRTIGMEGSLAPPSFIPVFEFE